MVEGRPDQAHRPGHVRENVIPKKPDGAGVAASSGVGDAHFVIIVMLDPAGNVAAAGWTVGVAPPRSVRIVTLLILLWKSASPRPGKRFATMRCFSSFCRASLTPP